MQAGTEAAPSRDGSPALADGVVLYRHMLTLRLLSARMVDLQRSEKVAFHASCLGEEAVIAGATMAARDGDWVFPGVREWGAAIVRGLPIAAYVHHAFGSGADAAKGHSAPDHPPARKQRVAPASGIAGAHLPQAVGAAWAAKIKKQDVAAIAIFGDAASCTMR
jgi:pyruvate dehydrogenase E1 component alpha subunit